MRNPILTAMAVIFSFGLGAPAQADEDQIKLVFNDPAHMCRISEHLLFDVEAEGHALQVNNLYGEDETNDMSRLTARVSLQLFDTKWVSPYLVVQVSGSYSSTDLYGSGELDEEFDNRDLSAMVGIRFKSDVVYAVDNGSQITYDITAMGGIRYRNMLEEEILINGQLDTYVAIRLPKSHVSFHVRTRNSVGVETSGQLQMVNTISSIGAGLTHAELGKAELGIGGGYVSIGDLDSGGQRLSNGDRPESWFEAPWIGGVINYAVGGLELWMGGGYSPRMSGNNDNQSLRRTDRSSGWITVFGAAAHF